MIERNDDEQTVEIRCPHPGVELVLAFDVCQARPCVEARPHTIGWTDAVAGDGHEYFEWATPFRIPDGRLVCEDCAYIWDFGGDLG